MKAYNTCDVIKAICENPKLKFQTKFSDGLIWEAFSRTDYPGIRCTYGKGRSTEEEAFLTTDSNTMSRGWQLVQEPVSFMEAVKAYAEGKVIRCEIGDKEYTYKKEYSNGLYVEMMSYESGGLSPIEILKGKWFIEEAE